MMVARPGAVEYLYLGKPRISASDTIDSARTERLEGMILQVAWKGNGNESLSSIFIVE